MNYTDILSTSYPYFNEIDFMLKGVYFSLSYLFQKLILMKD